MSSAAEIENEMLRDQVQHLQKKISTLEDTLEDMRAANERDDAAVHDRLKRYKEREEGIRKELAEGRQEAERLRKAEEKARVRVEEVEEAFRENAVTLENARADIETLRAEIAVRAFESRGLSSRLILCVADSIWRALRLRRRATRATRLASWRRVTMLSARSSRKRSRSSSYSLHRPRLRPVGMLICTHWRTRFTP